MFNFIRITTAFSISLFAAGALQAHEDIPRENILLMGDSNASAQGAFNQVNQQVNR